MKLSLPLLLALFFSVALAAPDNLSDAKSLMADGRYVAATEVLTALTEKDPENAAAWAALAECEWKLGDLAAAEKAGGTALDLDDESAENWKRLGQIAFQRGDNAIAAQAASSTIKLHFAEAEVKYKRALERNPDDPDLLWMIGWAKELQEYPDKAREYYEKQIEQFPGNPGGYRRLGAMLASEATRIGDGMTPEANEVRAKALAVYDQGIEKAGPDGELLYYKGLALEWKREIGAAKDCYAAAVRADPELYKAWLRLSEVGYSSDQLLTLTEEVRKTHPKSPTATTWAAYYLIRKGEPGRALDVAMATLEEHRENGAVAKQAVDAATVLLKSETERAVAAWKKIHELHPLSGSAANNLGMYHRDATKDYQQSLKWYLRAVEREPNSQDLVNDAALIYLFHTKEPQKSLPMFQQVLDLVLDYGQDPQRGYWDALENLCKYYWEVEHDPRKVIEYAEMRYETTNGVAPYNMSGVARQWAVKARRELGD